MKISFVFLSMIIISLLFAGMMILTITQLLSGSMQICRKENLELQNISAQTLNKLESMNKQIGLLRIQMKQAQLALALALASKNPPAIYAAKNKITKIKTMQNYMAQAQNFLLASHEQQMQIRSHAIISNLKIFFKKQKEKLSQIVLIESISTVSPVSRLAIQADQNSDPPPLYHTVENFIARQTSKTNWKWKLETNKSLWLSHWLNGSFTWNSTCDASLIKKGGLWEAILINSLDR